MKKFAYTILSIVVGSALAGSAAMAQTKKADASPAAAAESSMTKDQAQKAVLKKYPGANVISSDQKTVKGKSGWVVKFTRTGSNSAETVFVDEKGKLTRM